MKCMVCWQESADTEEQQVFGQRGEVCLECTELLQLILQLRKTRSPPEFAATVRRLVMITTRLDAYECGKKLAERFGVELDAQLTLPAPTGGHSERGSRES